MIDNNISDNPMITVTYFLKDKKKSGGSYSTYMGNVKKIDMLNSKILFVDGNYVNIDDIIEIEMC